MFSASDVHVNSDEYDMLFLVNKPKNPNAFVILLLYLCMYSIYVVLLY